MLLLLLLVLIGKLCLRIIWNFMDRIVNNLIWNDSLVSGVVTVWIISKHILIAALRGMLGVKEENRLLLLVLLLLFFTRKKNRGIWRAKRFKEIIWIWVLFYMIVIVILMILLLNRNIQELSWLFPLQILEILAIIIKGVCSQRKYRNRIRMQSIRCHMDSRR